MSKSEQLRAIVEELIDVVHDQTRELEKLIGYVERLTGHLGYENQFSVISSRLSDLHLRAKKLKSPAGRERTVQAGSNP
jgi:hypothetical protein